MEIPTKRRPRLLQILLSPQLTPHPPNGPNILNKATVLQYVLQNSLNEWPLSRPICDKVNDRHDTISKITPPILQKIITLTHNNTKVSNLNSLHHGNMVRQSQCKRKAQLDRK